MIAVHRARASMEHNPEMSYLGELSPGKANDPGLGFVFAQISLYSHHGDLPSESAAFLTAEWILPKLVPE